MLFCESKDTKQRIGADKHNAVELRQLSKNGALRCPIPICNGKVIFKCGSKKIPHFAHKKQCIYFDNEPESQEHLTGKKILEEILIKLFPESKVELEYWISETNQESDILITHPDGSRWAFEFQCSKISGDKWRKRHELYEKAGIRDFWIFDIALYIISIDKGMKSFIKMSDLFNTVREYSMDYCALYFLDTESRTFRITYSDYIDKLFYPNRLYNATEEDLLIDQFEMRSGNIYTPQYLKFRNKMNELVKEERKIAEEEKMFDDFEKKYDIILLKTVECSECDIGKKVLVDGPYSVFCGCSNYPKCNSSHSVIDLWRKKFDQYCPKCQGNYKQVLKTIVNGKPVFIWKCDSCGSSTPIYQNINTKEDLNNLSKVLERSRR